MGRPSKRPPRGRSEALRFRVYPEETAGLRELAAALNISPSRVLRCLLRESITGGPDFFDNGVHELRTMRHHLAAIGRNLNQLVRAANRGAPILNEDVLRVVDVARLQVAAVEDLHLRTIEAAAKRAWRPLYREVGLSAPFDTAAESQAATGRPVRQPEREPSQAERAPREADGG